jgi:fructose-bisphosphate aldolase class II|tara:strand:+ start:567 stop:1397 length:831 start_codon:yes stop_codon:yes gene_type:complete
MTIATLSEVLEPAKKNNYAVAGLVVLGWEDARCYAEAAEELGLPVILQAGPGCRENTPIPILGKMFRYLAEQSSSPVVCHIDHGYSLEECQMGIDNGFTSIMYDGSKLELNENIERTARIVELGHKAGISVEGEIGFVGYNEGKKSLKTNPNEAKKFADETHCDAMAISVGNTHLQVDKNTNVDIQDILAVQNLTDTALVLHGSSGIEASLRAKIAKETNVCKFNIGTELRKTFGDSLRLSMKKNPNIYDKIQLLSLTTSDIKKATKKVLENLSKV